MRPTTIQPIFNYKYLIKNTYYDRKVIRPNQYYLDCARSSLYHAIKYLKKKNIKIKNIFLPELICHEIIPIIQKLKLSITYYPISDSLDPDYNFIDHKSVDGESIILIVNYFGFCADWDQLNEIKAKKNVYFIEDNAHAFYGKYKDKIYGTLGDISFNSLRKILPLLSGSILQINTQPCDYYIKLDDRFPNLSELRSSFRFLKKRINSINAVSINRPQNQMNEALSMDIFSKRVYANLDYQNIFEKRVDNFKYWRSKLIHYDIEPIYNSETICPYVFPCYIENPLLQKKLLSWANKNNISIIKWPQLPIDSNPREKLKNIFCFPVNHQVNLSQIDINV
tara:strand:- start:2492 stop:3505 length:1014 start_codon:yes stop_codon:yes gene_type:complete